MIALHKYSDEYRELLKENGCGIFSIFCDICDGTGTRKFKNGEQETCYSCQGKGFYNTEGLVCGNCLLDGCAYCGQLGYFDISYSASDDEEVIRLI